MLRGQKAMLENQTIKAIFKSGDLLRLLIDEMGFYISKGRKDNKVII